MLDLLSHKGRQSVADLAGFGVQMAWGPRGVSVAKWGVAPLLSGTGMTLPLVEHARRTGVEFVEGTIVTGIFTDDKRCLGACAFNTRTREHFSIAAKATVVATGGAGRLYKRTDCPVRTTGDGYALLYELGLPFIDMEFTQFYPTGFDEPGFVCWTLGLYVAEWAPFTNEKGEPFLENLWKEWGITGPAQANSLTRDRSAIAVAKEWARGGEVYWHVDKVPDEFWGTHVGKRIKCLVPPGKKPDKPARVKPLLHYFIGGVRVGPDCSTAIPGLYATGEVTGGTDGANRIGGNALTMISVHGFVAAEAALAYAEQVAPAPVPDSHPSDRLAVTWGSNSEGPSPREFKQAINTIADSKLAVLRTESTLKDGLAALNELSEQVANMKAVSGEDIMEGYEATNLLTVGQLVGRGALEREESRGVHYRGDYPKEDTDWLKHVEQYLQDGELKTRIVPA
jgi:succinate dehydrogenase/fumarate reductase flavoprotein subunit